jgi:hypothetical protein
MVFLKKKRDKNAGKERRARGNENHNIYSASLPEKGK